MTQKQITAAAWRKNNREKINIYSLAYKKANQDKVKANNVAWQIANPEKLKINNAAWKKSNPDKVKGHQLVWRNANRDKIKIKSAEWRKKTNPDKVREQGLKKRYGITLDDYDKIFENQLGCCAICQTHQEKLVKTLNIDHDHQTGEIRGLLCGDCNRAIGLLKDNKDNLLRAAEYLKFYANLSSNT